MPASTQNEARTYLIDASPYIFRSFFSLPSSMTDAAGNQANAVYGFARFLLKLLREERPAAVAVCFDGSLTTSFRNRLYEPYKQGRELPPAALERQLDDCRQAAISLGLACAVDREYEADDLIASLCREVSDRGGSVTVVSSDKDLAQLVTDEVEWLDAAKGLRLDTGAVIERLGVPPRQIVDLLALAGDTVDNIPGARGVGPKTAVRLLALYRDIDDLYHRLDELPSSGLRGAAGLARRLAEQEETVRLSRRLATLAHDAPTGVDLDALSLRHLDTAGFGAFCSARGFEQLGRDAAALDELAES